MTGRSPADRQGPSRLVIQTVELPSGRSASASFDLEGVRDLHRAVSMLWTRSDDPDLGTFAAALLSASGSVPQRPVATIPGGGLATALESAHLVPALLGLDQVARLLACSERSVERLVETGQLAVVRVPGRRPRLVAAAELNRFIEAGGCQP